MLSVLIAIYSGDRPEWLTESMKSLRDQSRRADEIVVVVDGPISSELRGVVEDFQSTLPVKIVDIEKNMGLGAALRIGLQHCTYDYVARMDADDVCAPDRFETQLTYLEKHPEIDLLGTSIGEFDSEVPEKVYAFRHVPETHEEIVKVARLRNPFNHMTVMFKKDVIQRVGGYRSVRGLEDYDLWVRVLLSGARCANLPEPLVWARAGAGLVGRRGGWSYLTKEYLLLFDFYKAGFIGPGDLLIGIIVRTAVRLAPRKLRELSYRGIRLYGAYKMK